MKFLGYSFVALTSLFTIPAFANGSPVDLEDLQKKWESVAKVEGSQELMSMEFTKLDPDFDMISLMENSFFEASSGKKLENFRFARLKENSRSTLLETLFPRGVKEPKFCAGLPEPKVKESKVGTPEEQAKKLEKSKSSNCRSKVKDMLGGILHSNPEVVFGEFSYEDGSSHVIFYLQSLFFQNSYLKYEFQRS